MKMTKIALLLALLAPSMTGQAMTAVAAEAGKDVKGLYLLTDYPAVSVRPGTTLTISLRLQNYGLPPERFALSVDGAPAGWTATLLGGGQPVAAAMPATDQSVSLQLRLDVPADADLSTKTLTVKADGEGNNLTLPITVSLAKELPAKLALTPQLPSLRGTPKSSFDYTIAVKNDSGRNLTVSLAAKAPQNFETSFTEAYGSQELSSVPIDAGASKDVKLKVRPPSSVDAGSFPVEVTASAADASAETELTLDIVGQPRLSIAGGDGLVSARAQAGQPSTVPVVISNDGSSAAEDVELSGSGPTRLESRVRQEDSRSHRARPDRRSQRHDHADGKIAGRRLYGDDPCRHARGNRVAAVPRHGHHFHHLGPGRGRHHRGGAADHGGRGCKVRTAMSEPVITARGLTKRYGDAVVVDAIDFDILRGETFGLLGPNGAGKTTTILMMLGLTEVSAGAVTVAGHDPVREPLAVKRRVGYLPDAVGFYDNMTATENLAYTAKLMGLGRDVREARIAESLARVRLGDVAHKRVATFSRGMRQRLGLAELIMKRAEIAILDEPTSGLDPQSTHEFLTMIGDLKREGVTTLITSHLLDQVQQLCDRVALFQGGRILIMGTVPELARQVLGAGFVVDVEASGAPAAELAARLGAIAGVQSVQRTGDIHYRLTADHDVRPDAARAVVAASGALTRLSVADPSLDTIYTRFFERQAEVRHASPVGWAKALFAPCPPASWWARFALPTLP